MPAVQPLSPALICGDDEFAVKQRAKQLHHQWCEELGGMDHEIIEAAVANSGEALTALARLREALQTLPFFGTGKVIWLRDCNFLGDERAASAQAVTETLNELAEELKKFSWQGVRLLVSAGKVDKRKTFLKRSIKLGRSKLFQAGRRMTATGRNGRKSRRARPFACGKRKFPRKRWRNWSAASAPIRASLTTRLKNCACSPATAKSWKWRTWPPFARETKRRGRSRWATPWATVICRDCCGGWTRNCGK